MKFSPKIAILLFAIGIVPNGVIAQAPPLWIVPPAAAAAPPPPNPQPVQAADESEELINIDKGMAENIQTNGPLIGYGAFLSAEGVLYDAGGGSPPGPEAAKARFETFPANVILERKPERAMASGGAGASWGSYAVKRENTVLSDGRYIAIWRKEPEGWKIVSELAAGRNTAPPALPARPVAPRVAPAAPAAGVGAMPTMRDALGRPITAPPSTN